MVLVQEEEQFEEMMIEDPVFVEDEGLDEIEDGVQRWAIAPGLLALVMVMAGVMRFSGLESLPLSAEEARQAFASYQFWQTGTDPAIGSPAYFSLTSFLKPLIGQSDMAMRLIPALFGTALVGLPWLLRRQIGTIGAIVAAVLLAVSPLQSISALTAGGDSIALFAGLLLFAAWINYQETEHFSWLVTAFVAIGIGLASSALFYSALVSLLIFWLAQNTIGPRINPDFSLPDTNILQKAALMGGVVFVVISTIGLWQPAGLGAAANLPVQWAAQFGLGEGWAVPLMALVRYEIGLIVLGVVAIIWATWQGSDLGMLLVYWILGCLLLTAIQAGSLGNAALITLPAALLIGALVNQLVEFSFEWQVGAIAGLVLVWGLLVLVNFGRFIRTDNELIAALLISGLLLLAISTSTLAISNDFSVILQGAVIGLIAISAFYSWGTGWGLTHLTGNNPHELWVSEGTDSDVHYLRNTLQEFSYQTDGAHNNVEIISTIDSPILHWYLRDFENVTFTPSVPPGSAAPVVITPASETPVLSEGYASATYDLQAVGAVETGEEMTLNKTLRWWFFREAPAPLEKEQLTLWLNLLVGNN